MTSLEMLFRRPRVERIYLPDYDMRLLDVLARLRPQFKQMRTVFSAHDGIGLGSLPDTNNWSEGALIRIEKSFFGKIKYRPRDRIAQEFGYPLITLADEEKSRIIVAPNFLHKETFLVTIYEKLAAEKDGSIMSDDVIIGVIAHELAEWRKEYSGIALPQTINNIIQEIEADINPSERSDPGDKKVEAMYDLIAALFGYKKEILAALNFVRSKSSVQNGFSPKAMDYFNYRIEQVKHYARELLTSGV